MTPEVSRHTSTGTSSASPPALLNPHGVASPETSSGAGCVLKAAAVETDDEPVERLLDHDGRDVEERVDAAAAQHDEHEVAEPVPVQVGVRRLLEQRRNYY